VQSYCWDDPSPPVPPARTDRACSSCIRVCSFSTASISGKKCVTVKQKKIFHLEPCLFRRLCWFREKREKRREEEEDVGIAKESIISESDHFIRCCPWE